MYKHILSPILMAICSCDDIMIIIITIITFFLEKSSQLFLKVILEGTN